MPKTPVSKKPKAVKPKSSATTKKLATKKTKAPEKKPFDKEAFVFETPIEKIEEALQRLEDQEADPLAEPLTKDQTYWWGNWLVNLPEAKRRGLTHVPTCAIENAVLGLYDKPKTRKRK